MLNAAFNGIDASGGYDPARAPMFWDVRATSLEAQALEPLKAHEEMRGDAYPEDAALDTVVATPARDPRLSRPVRESVRRIVGGVPPRISAERSRRSSARS